MYYRGAAAAIVVFDVTNPVCGAPNKRCPASALAHAHPLLRCRVSSPTQDSFEGAKSWVRELKRRGDPNVVIALAGNKSDIVAKRKVDAEVADEYAKEHSLIYMDTSAKTAHNVKELFDAIGAWQAVGGWLAWRGSRRRLPRSCTVAEDATRGNQRRLHSHGRARGHEEGVRMLDVQQLCVWR